MGREVSKLVVLPGAQKVKQAKGRARGKTDQLETQPCEMPMCVSPPKDPIALCSGTGGDHWAVHNDGRNPCAHDARWRSATHRA